MRGAYFGLYTAAYSRQARSFYARMRGAYLRAPVFKYFGSRASRVFKGGALYFDR